MARVTRAPDASLFDEYDFDALYKLFEVRFQRVTKKWGDDVAGVSVITAIIQPPWDDILSLPGWRLPDACCYLLGQHHKLLNLLDEGNVLHSMVHRFSEVARSAAAIGDLEIITDGDDELVRPGPFVALMLRQGFPERYLPEQLHRFIPDKTPAAKPKLSRRDREIIELLGEAGSFSETTGILSLYICETITGDEYQSYTRERLGGLFNRGLIDRNNGLYWLTDFGRKTFEVELAPE